MRICSRYMGTVKAEMGGEEECRVGRVQLTSQPRELCKQAPHDLTGAASTNLNVDRDTNQSCIPRGLLYHRYHRRPQCDIHSFV